MAVKMDALPEVVVGGFPNAGTSFLCNLVVQLGKSPGSKQHLKGGDAHNRWGYFEHLEMRKLAWTAGGWHQFRPENESQLPEEPLSFSDERGTKLRQLILKLAREDTIEVYKDNALPLIFRLFPAPSKYIIIDRDLQSIYLSPLKSGGAGYQCGIEELRRGHMKYMNLVYKMGLEVDCLLVRYEDFSSDFTESLRAICQHVDIPWNSIDSGALAEVFRPRNFHSAGVREVKSSPSLRMRLKAKLVDLLSARNS